MAYRSTDPWISSAEDYLLPVPVLPRMFRGKMLAMLKSAHNAGRLLFFGPHADLADKAAFKAFLEPLYHTKWHVYAKRPFAGPEQVGLCRSLHAPRGHLLEPTDRRRGAGRHIQGQ